MKVLLEEMAQPFLVRIIESNQEAINARLEEIWNSKKEELVLDGFRKGKVPQQVAEKTFGFQKLYKDYVDELVLKALEDLGKQQNTTVVDIQQIVPEKLGKDGIIMQAVVYLKPQVLELDYSNVTVSKQDDTVSEGEVEQQIQTLREQVATFELVEDRSVEWDDIVVISYVGSIDGVPFEGGTASKQQLQLTKQSFIPGFGEEMIGLNLGESKTFEVIFPEDYHAAHLAGKKTSFDLTLHEIKVKKMPESDEALAAQLGVESFQTLKENLSTHLGDRKKKAGRSQVESDIVNELLSRASIAPLPTSMVQKRLQQILANEASRQGVSPEKYLEKQKIDMATFERAYFHAATRDLKIQLILDHVATSEGFEISQETRQAYVDEEAPKMGMSSEEVFKSMSLDHIDMQLKLKMSFDFLVDSVKYMDV